MRILMVSSYPPARDGIGLYAVQQVKMLRAQGHDVEVLSPGPSAAHHHLNLAGPRGGLALAKRVRGYDRVIVQYHPDYFFRPPYGQRERLQVALAYAAAFGAARQTQIVVHEVDCRWGVGSSPAAVAFRAMFLAATRLGFHTQTEAEDFAGALRFPRSKIEVIEHGRAFLRRTRHTRQSARRSLGLGPEEKVLVSLGFIQPHKGFHRAITGFTGLAEHDASFHIVGSLRVEEPDYVAYLARLESMADEVPGTHVHTGYVSDELFDRWIVAADAVVLPYEHIWSSSVLERATLYGTPVIASRVGGLHDQTAGRDVTFVDDDEQLHAAMAAVVTGTPMTEVARTGRPPQPWDLSGQDLHRTVQEAVQDRAAAVRRVPRGLTGAPVRPSSRSRQATEPLLATNPVRLPDAASTRFTARFVKRVVRRLTAWELEPVVHEMNKLREATIRSVERAADPRTGVPGVPGPDPVNARTDGPAASR